jgi:hypothetical protein
MIGFRVRQWHALNRAAPSLFSSLRLCVEFPVLSAVGNPFQLTPLARLCSIARITEAIRVAAAFGLPGYLHAKDHEPG